MLHFIHFTAMQLKWFVLSHMKLTNYASDIQYIPTCPVPVVMEPEYEDPDAMVYSLAATSPAPLPIQEPDTEVSGITIVPPWVSLRKDCYCNGNTIATYVADSMH